MAPKRQHGQVGNNNNRKSDEKFFMPYTWATDAKPAAESEEDLKELRMQHRKLQLAKRAYKVGSRKDKAEEHLRIIKAKINDAVMRFSSSGTKTGDAQSCAMTTYNFLDFGDEMPHGVAIFASTLNEKKKCAREPQGGR